VGEDEGIQLGLPITYKAASTNHFGEDAARSPQSRNTSSYYATPLTSLRKVLSLMSSKTAARS
jgi:hypothetical protein